MRGASTQPSYNFFTGESSNNPARPPSRQGTATRENPYAQSTMSRESSKENMAPPDAEEYETQRRRIEELKAEVGTLKYTINSFEQEKEMARLQHETELRDARRRAEEDFKRKQAAESEKGAAERKNEALQAELDMVKEEMERKQRELERKAREAHDEARLLQEQLEDLNSAKEDAARINEKRYTDLQTQLASTQQSLQELSHESQAREDVFQKVQAQLLEKDAALGNLEAEVLRLRAQTGDAATMEVIRRELKEQVDHMRALEAKNHEQFTELKHLRSVHKAVEVVEEEKRTLLRKLEAAEVLEKQLDEERIQRQRLEDERRAWTAYLQAEGSSSGEVEFDSPEAMARALVQERYNSAALTEKLGELQPEIIQRDSVIKGLEARQGELIADLEKARAAGSSPASSSTVDKQRMRLERQRALAVKEVDYLRAQLKMFDAEDMTFHSENFDRQKTDRIQELEDLVDKYKVEMQTMHAEMSLLEASAGATEPLGVAAAGTKRPRPEDGPATAESEQLGQLARKNRKLQDELSALQTAHKVLEADLSVARSQLAAAKESARIRVLSLRSNPTSDFEAVKVATLNALRQENKELLAHIQSPASTHANTFPTIPMSVLAAAQREIAEAKAARAAKAEAAAQAEAKPAKPELTEAERKAARDARYAARKARKR